MSSLTEVVSWLGIIGIPSIFTIVSFLVKACWKFSKELKILKTAVQAQMRGVLLEKYHEYIDRGYVTEDEMKQWESEYQAYHSLGENGIMDSRRDALMKLPSKDTTAI